MIVLKEVELQSDCVEGSRAMGDCVEGSRATK